MKTLKQVIFVVGFLLMVSCSKPAEPVAIFDLEKAKTAITAANQKFMDAIGSGDTVTSAANYHSEGVILIPNMEPISGKEIIKFHSNGMKAGISGIAVASTEVWGDENNVFEIGTYELFGKDKVMIDRGKYMVVWRQENGEWKMYRDMWNTSTPMPAPPK